jgi:O-antigen ligase
MLTARSVAKSTLSKLALVSALVPMLLALVLTQSRGAWVSLGVSLLVMLFLTVSRNKSWARLMVIIVFTVVIAVSVIYFAGDMMSSRMSTMTAAQEGEDVSGGRFKIWQGAIGMIKERPLTGVGIGNFDHGFYRYRPPGFNARAVYAHNDYLHMAAEMGVFAPVIMLWIFIAAIRAGFRKRDRSPYAFGCAIGVISLAFHGTVDFNFHIPANMILFTVWLGIITSE